MANRVSVEISANVSGFEQGMNQATESAKRYETETRKISDSTINFNKELREAKKSVKDLAGTFAQLSAAEKNSQFGRELARQLQEAKERAAELIDQAGDLNEELKHMASDTRGLDTLSDALGIVGDGFAATMGLVAQFTGKEEDARKAVVAFTTAQAALGTVTKISNALQKQSNVMLAITKVQTLAAAAAERMKTAAQVQGTVATKAATAAQAAFNAVAYANPYVLLAAAILGVVGAIGIYIASTKDAETEEERHAREVAELTQRWNEYKHTVAESAADMISQYQALQIEWLALKTTEEKNKFLDDNKAKFKAMGFEIDNINELEDLFVRNSAAVVNALKARAEAEAWGEIYKERLKKKLEADYHGTVENGRYYYTAHAGDVIDADEASRAGINIWKSYQGQTATTASMSGTYRRGLTAQEAVIINQQRLRDAQEKQAKETKELTDLENNWTDSMKRARDASSQLSRTLRSSQRSGRTGSGSGSGKGGSTSSDAQAAAGSITKLEEEISDLQKKLKDGLIPEDQVDATAKRIKELQKQVKDLKVQYQLEEPEKVKTKLEQLQENLKNANDAYILAVDTDDEQARQEALEAYWKAQEELDKYKLSITIEPKPDMDAIRQQKAEIQQIVTDALTPDESKVYDFEAIKSRAGRDPAAARAVEDAEKKVAAIEKIEEAQRRLNDIMNDERSNDTQIADAQAGLEALHEKWQQLINDVNIYSAANEMLQKQDDKLKTIAKTTSIVGDTVQAAGDMFSALGEAADDKNFQVAGIIAKAVATVALSFAEALTTCKTWIDWLAFGLTGSATMLTMIGQIKSATSGYAEGGIVGGSSYHGDNILARVNSGEMLLNQRQQKNLFNLLDHGVLGGGNNKVEVTGVIRGTDLLLVQKNTNKKLSRTGSQISIGG